MVSMRIQYGTTVDQVTLFSAMDWLENRQCDSARRGYVCGHRGCERIELALAELKAYDLGWDIPGVMSISEIVKLVRSKRSWGRAARSRAAILNEPYIEFLERWCADMERKIAA
jgi:hypothetical protein